MIAETPPSTLRPPRPTGAEDHDRPDRALEGPVSSDQWIADFMTRLNDAIDDVVRKK